MLEGPSAAAADVASSVKSSKTAALVDQYTEKNRAKSLVEQHQEKLKDESKQKKKKKQKTGKEEAEPQEWRLWDREKDLEIKPKAMQLTGKTLAGGLSSRFGGSQAGSRTFL